MTEPGGQIMHCSDCGGRSYGWPRCAKCEVARCFEDVRPVENVAPTLFEEHVA